MSTKQLNISVLKGCLSRVYAFSDDEGCQSNRKLKILQPRSSTTCTYINVYMYNVHVAALHTTKTSMLFTFAAVLALKALRTVTNEIFVDTGAR